MKNGSKARRRGAVVLDPNIAMVSEDWPSGKCLAVADKLDRWSKQLRAKAQLRAAPSGNSKAEFVDLRLTPKMQEALLAYASRRGEPRKKNKLVMYAGWVFETALMMLPQIERRASAFARYRDAEGLDHWQFTEAEIAKSLAEFEHQFANDAEDDDDDHGDDWKKSA